MFVLRGQQHFDIVLKMHSFIEVKLYQVAKYPQGVTGVEH